MHNPTFTDYEGMRAEYLTAVSGLNLELPEGVVLPSSPPGDPSATTEWEIGCGEVAALFAWLHEVEIAAVTAHNRGDHSEAQRWVRVASQFVETDTFAEYNDPNVPISWYEAVIVPAMEGDLSMMAAEAGLEPPVIREDAPSKIQTRQGAGL